MRCLSLNVIFLAVFASFGRARAPPPSTFADAIESVSESAAGSSAEARNLNPHLEENRHSFNLWEGAHASTSNAPPLKRYRMSLPPEHPVQQMTTYRFFEEHATFNREGSMIPFLEEHPTLQKEMSPIPIHEKQSAHVQQNHPAAVAPVDDGLTLSENIDRQFATLLRVPDPKFLRVPDPTGQIERIKIPHEIVYISSVWLDEIYLDFVSLFIRPGARLKTFESMDASDELVREIVSRRKNLFRAGGTVYLWDIPPGLLTKAKINEPVQVLLKYHDRLDWDANRSDGGKPLLPTVTVWSTANQGSQLALLRAFRISEPTWKSIEQLAPVKRYKIVGWKDSFFLQAEERKKPWER